MQIVGVFRRSSTLGENFNMWPNQSAKWRWSANSFVEIYHRHRYISFCLEKMSITIHCQSSALKVNYCVLWACKCVFNYIIRSDENWGISSCHLNGLSTQPWRGNPQSPINPLRGDVLSNKNSTRLLKQETFRENADHFQFHSKLFVTVLHPPKRWVGSNLPSFILHPDSGRWTKWFCSESLSNWNKSDPRKGKYRKNSIQ